jgi:hypothetical protein
MSDYEIDTFIESQIDELLLDKSEWEKHGEYLHWALKD